MAKHVAKKFSWVIKDFASLQSQKPIYSDPVLIGDSKWRLSAYPKGYKVDDHFSLYLRVADLESLPSDWRRYVKYRLTVAQQDPKKFPVQREGQCWFDKVSPSWGSKFMISLNKIHDKDEGFLVNGEIILIAEVDVFEVSGTLGASEKSKVSSSPLKKRKLNDDSAESNESLKEALSIKESMVINAWVSSSSFTETVRRIFEKHPDIAVDFRAKSQHLRTTCMNFLLNLIETLCKSVYELSNDDLVDADIALTYLKEVNFKVDWLEKKLDQVKEKKEKEQSVLAKLQELEAELLATRTTLSFDDVV